MNEELLLVTDKEIVDLSKKVSNLLDEIYSYTAKPNKAKSLRIRKGLGQIKNDTPYYRRFFVEMDKAGY